MMRNFRGVVCEKKDDYYVFLTSEGEFLRGTPLVDDPMIGSEAEFQLLEAKAPFLLTQIKPKILAPILVAAIVLIFCVASLIPQQTSAYAYVQLEGEHAVEIGVDEDGQVISLRSLDEDTPIDINNWEDLALAAVLVHAVKQVGAAQDELVITTVYENETNQEVKAQVNQAVKEVKAVQSEQHINVTESSAEERKKANENNTSIQKYKQKEQQPVKENKTSVEQQNNSSVNKHQKTSVEQQNNSSAKQQKKSSVDEKQKNSVEKQKPVVPAPSPAATQKPEKEKKEQPNKHENAPKNKTHNPENKLNPNQSKDKPKHSNDRKHKDEKQHPSRNDHKGVGPKDNNKGHDKPKNNHHNGNNQGNHHRDKNNNHRP
ncbi:hypothetical protein NSQ95_03430 [Psychrobacillus sp. FSL W7-1457]|uniref:anti-sigma factor domain-containing protein n=1 Tax=Psychrobacillus sp. FSL W7-1457 TaxID=2954547 RepID=UPI00315AA98C